MVAEKKTRRIEHKGRVIEIALTDDEFKTWLYRLGVLWTGT